MHLHAFKVSTGSEVAALADELTKTLGLSSKDAAKAAHVLGSDQVGLATLANLGVVDKAFINLAVAELSAVGKTVLLKRYADSTVKVSATCLNSVPFLYPECAISVCSLPTISVCSLPSAAPSPKLEI